MELLLIRHAIARDRDEFAATGESDDLRPLTTKGKERMARAARGLAGLVPGVDQLASSPLTRAVETADILRQTYGGQPIVTLPQLAPGQPPERFFDWLRKDHRLGSHGGVVAAVGHEPDLSILLALALTGTPRPLHRFKKGGAALVEFTASVTPGAGQLLWALAPKHLRGLATVRG